MWFSGRGKQQKLSYAARRNKVSLASLVPSWRLERVPRLALSNNNNSGDDRKTSVVVKVSEGGAISLPHGWSAQKVTKLT